MNRTNAKVRRDSGHDGGKEAQSETIDFTAAGAAGRRSG